VLSPFTRFPVKGDHGGWIENKFDLYSIYKFYRDVNNQFVDRSIFLIFNTYNQSYTILMLKSIFVPEILILSIGLFLKEAASPEV
jgi:hypothetical protein